MKTPLRLALLGIAALAVVVVMPLVGMQALPFSVLFDPRGTDPVSYTHLTLPTTPYV